MNYTVQWRSQDFTKGDKPGGVGTEVPSGIQGRNMETLENTNEAVTKIGLHAPMSPLWLRP